MPDLIRYYLFIYLFTEHLRPFSCPYRFDKVGALQPAFCRPCARAIGACRSTMRRMRPWLLGGPGRQVDSTVFPASALEGRTRGLCSGEDAARLRWRGSVTGNYMEILDTA